MLCALAVATARVKKASLLIDRDAELYSIDIPIERIS